MRGKVYIIHEVMRKNPSTGVYEPAFDFRKAVEYGDLEVCLPAGRVALSPGPTIQTLKTKLKDFCDEDYLLAVGDPSAMCIASAIAANNNMGRFNLLKWDKDLKQYIKVSVDLYPSRGKEL